MTLSTNWIFLYMRSNPSSTFLIRISIKTFNFSLQAVVFVIDSSNRERLDEAQGELIKLITEKELKDACLLILLNKQVSRFEP